MLGHLKNTCYLIFLQDLRSFLITRARISKKKKKKDRWKTYNLMKDTRKCFIFLNKNDQVLYYKNSPEEINIRKEKSSNQTQI